LDDITLNINAVVPCGIIAAELLSNVMKHSFPQGRGGTIRLSLKREGQDQIRLTVADDGIGFPEGFDFRKAESMGLQIVHMLADQIDVRVELGPGPETSVSLVLSEVWPGKKA
jgi:two-component sensor histidine kinase